MVCNFNNKGFSCQESETNGRHGGVTDRILEEETGIRREKFKHFCEFVSYFFGREEEEWVWTQSSTRIQFQTGSCWWHVQSPYIVASGNGSVLISMDSTSFNAQSSGIQKGCMQTRRGLNNVVAIQFRGTVGNGLMILNLSSKDFKVKKEEKGDGFWEKVYLRISEASVSFVAPLIII